MQELFLAGGAVMWPLMALSAMAAAAIVQRCWFWANLLRQEQQIVTEILAIAAKDFPAAAEIAKSATNSAIGRFLYAPLALIKPEPDLFQLALESAADQELSAMLRYEKLLESVVALSPLLGLLGTVLGLIQSFSSIQLGEIVSNSQTQNLTQGIGQALVSTATGLVVAIFTLAFQRLFMALHAGQVKIFRRAGNALELAYRQYWQAK
ncbi:outer membrane transport energization protein ExbB [Thalassoporum mexicanum PCC 7367]|uniref:MotA/TolQ/ExbB proton channel family protein n=1 Tax=Thalassoporum mexicanum TaxID=3457544 RepID=UPI00029FE229|nr:MotA/TolQ/ExbB proton channel family protein [Pseudanabaena sp. PCC 7367]AFY68531.1 outer membrane transport energization protein ExbB [Pseudanabaena sp. PCC 7367]